MFRRYSVRILNWILLGSYLPFLYACKGGGGGGGGSAALGATPAVYLPVTPSPDTMLLLGGGLGAMGYFKKKFHS